ncbi:alpha/beta fold hydrolase [Amycolatopsis lurida]
MTTSAANPGPTTVVHDVAPWPWTWSPRGVTGSLELAHRALLAGGLPVGAVVLGPGGESQAVRAYLDERSLPQRLAPLGKPLLVLFGEEDRRWRPSSAGDYRAVPGATVQMLPGVGHSPSLEDPALTAVPLLVFTTASHYFLIS